MTQVPILTYHSAHISGNEYSSNDHVAFHHDIRLIHALGQRIISLDSLVDRILARDADLEGLVALTMDDATNFDYYDLPHPTWGAQRSMLNIMKDFVEEFGVTAQPNLHATSFVIASPDARRELDRTCLIDRNWYTDEWWLDAIDSGLMAIGNHSWDHNHPSLTTAAQSDQARGTFLNVDNYADADAQIRRASEFLANKTDGRASQLFAYPFGEVNGYLANSYLPKYRTEHKLRAAFATRQGPIVSQNAIWTLPRLVFRDDWSNPEELEAILVGAWNEHSSSPV